MPITKSMAVANRIDATFDCGLVETKEFFSMTQDNDIASDELDRMHDYKGDLLMLLTDVLKHIGTGKDEVDNAINCEQAFDELIHKFCYKLSDEGGGEVNIPMSPRYADWLRKQRMRAQPNNED